MSKVECTEVTSDMCLAKLKDGEPFFVLRAQDVTAHLLVRLWADMQVWLQQNIDRGFTVVGSVDVLEHRIAKVCQDADFASKEPVGKIQAAYVIADEMQSFIPKKVAD